MAQNSNYAFVSEELRKAIKDGRPFFEEEAQKQTVLLLARIADELHTLNERYYETHTVL